MASITPLQAYNNNLSPDGLSNSALKKEAEVAELANTAKQLQSVPTIESTQIKNAKESEAKELYTKQNERLQQVKAQQEMQQLLEGNTESIERMKQQMSYVDLTEYGIDNTDINKQEFQFYAEEYFSAFTTQLKHISEGENVQNALTVEEKNKIITEEMKAFQHESFPQFFQKFRQETNANEFTFQDILENSIIHSPEVQKKLNNSLTYLAEQNVKRHTSLAWHDETLPGYNADMDTYIEEEAKFILRESNSRGKFKYLTQGNITEPFAEVIQFVQNGGGTLSPKAYSAYINMLNDKRHNTKKKWLQANIKNANRLWKHDNNQFKQQKINKNFVAKQKDIVADERFYQLGMQRIAEKAEKIMNETNPETGEKIHKETDFIQSLSITLTEEQKTDFIQSLSTTPTEEQKITLLNSFKNTLIEEQKTTLLNSLKNKNHYAYTVKNKFVESADSSLEGQTLGRITPANFLIDQIFRSGLMVMVFANLLVGFKSGNWSASLPYIIGGSLGIGALGNGVMNSGIEKMFYPEKMLNNIVKESWNNKHYRSFFKNEWEVSLAQNMDWSPKKDITKDIKTIKKDNGKKTHIYHKNENGVETRTKLGLSSYDRNVKHTFEESLTINDFTNDNPMSKYLPNSHYMGPDGIMYTKEEYLQKVEEHSDHNSGNATQTSNHVRFIMYEKIADRIGQKDSYIPLFNQLHEHYKHSKPN